MLVWLIFWLALLADAVNVVIKQWDNSPFLDDCQSEFCEQVVHGSPDGALPCLRHIPPGCRYSGMLEWSGNVTEYCVVGSSLHFRYPTTEGFSYPNIVPGEKTQTKITISLRRPFTAHGVAYLQDSSIGWREQEEQVPRQHPRYNCGAHLNLNVNTLASHIRLASNCEDGHCGTRHWRRIRGSANSTATPSPSITEPECAITNGVSTAAYASVQVVKGLNKVSFKATVPYRVGRQYLCMDFDVPGSDPIAIASISLTYIRVNVEAVSCVAASATGEIIRIGIFALVYVFAGLE
eukprot:Gregarina_sp_Poly_1__1963@NODE_1512_length_3967_cov_63_832308_g1003_i0_p2_GENE_NODE_1512_length_3967_cov_63_832308_g1003_i0NODE_1512_length_3967_cov_63_832308_g1003_i0_p2_ORF_typecomplete_len293_score25_36DHC_N2/PF08393_13/0_077_NODE_1512_length_3967_cov_63_832308_g1003_i030103888